MTHRNQGPGQGAVSIVQRIAKLAVSVVETRISLAVVEIEEEKNRLIKLILMSGIGLICLAFALISALILICLSIDPSYRFMALAVFTGVLLLTALIFMIITVRLTKKSSLLRETRNSLKIDKALLEDDDSV